MTQPKPISDNGASNSELDARQQRVEAVNRRRTQSALELKGRRGATWFFWIAGLSLANTFLLYDGGHEAFVIGLAATMLVDGFAHGLAQVSPQLAKEIMFAALAADVCVAALLFACGWLACKRWISVFAIGMTLYFVDGLIFAIFQDWMFVGFHALALCWMWNGFRAYRQLAQLEKATSEKVVLAAASFGDDLALLQRAVIAR